jgi:putative ABC transport system permease protein
VLGRDIDAKVAVIRHVDVGGFGAGFSLVLNPGALEGAQLRQVAIAKASRAEEAAVTRALGRDFPQVDDQSRSASSWRAATELFDKVALAVRSAAAVALLAALLVLAGAIAARAQERTREGRDAQGPGRQPRPGAGRPTRSSTAWWA